MLIETLKVFCDLVETESFTKAGQNNGVSQSAVSQQVTAMQQIFKSPLVEHTKKKFRLTPEGQLLYDHSRRIVSLYGSLGAKLLELKEIISGNIRMATIYSVGLHDLPLYIRKFKHSHPATKVHTNYRGASQVYEEVMGNVVDLGFIANPVKNPKLEIVALRKEPLVLICHPQHPFAKQKSIKFKQLAGQKIIGFEPDIPTRKALDKILKEHGVDPRHAMEFDNIETVKRAVEIDAGISIVPQGTVIQDVAKQTLAAVPIEDGSFYRPIAAIYKKNKVLSPAMKQFLTLLKDTA